MEKDILAISVIVGRSDFGKSVYKVDVIHRQVLDQ